MYDVFSTCLSICLVISLFAGEIVLYVTFTKPTKLFAFHSAMVEGCISKDKVKCDK